MNSGATAERVYDAVKKRILKGAYGPGERIEITALADALDSSNTPVRDALHLLVGERLVETRAGEGFHLPHLDVAQLTDLYRWNVQILLLSLRGGARGPANWSNAVDSVPENPAQRAGALFARIARRAANPELLREVQSINDRLYSVRLAEANVIADWAGEITILTTETASDDLQQLRRSIMAYHRRRQRLATEILRATYHRSETA